MGSGDIAIKVVMDLTGVTHASTQFEGAMRSMASSSEAASKAIEKIGIAVGVATVAITAVVAVAKLLKGSFDGLLEYANQIDTLQNILGVTSAEATKMAVSMKAVGLSVEEGTTAFAYFARQVADTDRMIQQSDKAMATATKDAGEQTLKVSSDLAKQRIKIASDLAIQIADIQAALGKTLEDMERSNNQALAAIAKDSYKIDFDAAQARAKLESDTAKSINKVDTDLKDALHKTRNARDRRELRKQAAERKKEIIEAAAERAKEIETQRAERQQELAERRALLVEEFNYRKQQAAEAADLQIAHAQRAAAEQRKTAEESAKAQGEAIAKALDKQLATTREQLKNDPFMQAVEKLNIGLYDTQGKIKPVAVLLGEMRDKLNAMPDGPEKTNVVMQLLGKSGAKFLEWLELSTEEVNKIYEENKAQYELTNEQLKQIKELQITWARIVLAVEGIGMTLAVTILPTVIQLTGWVKDNLLPAIQAINGLLKSPEMKAFFNPQPTNIAPDTGLPVSSAAAYANAQYVKKYGSPYNPNWASAEQKAEYDRWMKEYKPMASGGYIPRTQPYLLHAGEYVLNPQQTQRMASSMNTYNFSNIWQGQVNGADRGSIERWAQEAAYKGIAQAMRGAA